MVGKGENTGNQHFLLFPHCFQKILVQGCKRSELCGKGLTLYFIDAHFSASTTDSF